MQVPLAASTHAGRDDRFEQVLEQAVAAPQQRVDPRLPDGERVDAEPEAAGADDSGAALPAADTTPPADRDLATADVHENRADLAAGTNGAPAAADATDVLRRAGSTQSAAADGAGAPRATAPSSEPLLAAAILSGANASNASSAPPAVAASRGVGAIGGVRAADGAARGVELPAMRTAAALRTPGTSATYRTSAATSAELIEHARDSVFKQILMKLDGEGGEMRMRLEPPDLGELDLRLVVQHGNRLELTIAAERQDLAQLLQRHLDELKHTLQQAGLEVASASVQTRSEFARDQARRQASHDHGVAHGAADDIEPTSSPRRGGYVSATGLDFWA